MPALSNTWHFLYYNGTSNPDKYPFYCEIAVPLFFSALYIVMWKFRPRFIRHWVNSKLKTKQAKAEKQKERGPFRGAMRAAGLSLASLIYEVSSQQLFKLAEIFKGVFLFFVLLSSPSLTDYLCTLHPTISPLFGNDQGLQVSTIICDPLPASMDTPCSYWDESQLTEGGANASRACLQVLELCSVQVDGALYTWGVWFMAMFYEAFSTVYLLIAEVQEGKERKLREVQIPLDTEISQREFLKAKQDIDSFITPRYYILLGIFASGCLVWSCVTRQARVGSTFTQNTR